MPDGRAAACPGRESRDAPTPHLRRHGANVAAIVVGRGLVVLGTLAGVRLLTEYVSPELFGRYKLALAAVSLVTGILVRPFIQYATRAYHDAAARGVLRPFLKRYGRSFVAYVGWVGLAVLAGGHAATFGGWQLGSVELTLIAAVLVLQAIVEYDRALFITRGRQRDAELIGAGTTWLIPISVAGFVHAGESLSVILAAHAGALTLVSAFPRLRRRRPDREPPRPGVLPGGPGPAWAYAWPLVIAGCLAWLVHESDRFILGYYHGSRAVGLYTAAYGLASAPFLAATGAISQFMQSIVFAASARADTAGAPILSPAMVAATALVGVGGVLAFWLAGDQVAGLALAAGYRSAAPELLTWIAAGYACFGIAMCFDLAAYGAGRTTSMMIASGVASVANVGLDLLLVPVHGAAGAAWATAASLSAYLLCMAGLFRRGARTGVRRLETDTSALALGAARESARLPEVSS